jgi:hypothetical protein
MKYIGIILLSIAGYFVLGYTLVALNIIALPLFQLSTKVDQNYQIIQKTYNADNQIYNYHWFQERAGAITATQKKRDIAKQAVTDYELGYPTDKTQWSFEVNTEDARLRAVYQGLQNQVEDLTNEYNARAGEVDRNIFINGLKTYIPLN